ncbi:MAG TPA: hypothetical protein VGJ04_09075 [Pirellulales bacterium]|jgi:hypothetical protein
MSLRRWAIALSILMVLSVIIPAWGEGATSSQWAAVSPAEAASHSEVQKDDSQLTVIETQADYGTPIVDTAAKKKKASNSIWNKMMHPSKWFSSSKKK